MYKHFKGQSTITSFFRVVDFESDTYSFDIIITNINSVT